MLTLKIIAATNLEALETIEKIFPRAKIKELKVDNGYQIHNEKVYTITVNHDAKKA